MNDEWDNMKDDGHNPDFGFEECDGACCLGFVWLGSIFARPY